MINYNKYSDYLKNKYGEKVYKLPVNLPITCPNRIDSFGCSFCSDKGTGFEAMASSIQVREQLIKTKEFITKKYKAKKFIAYFQNFTNTFIPLNEFKRNLEVAASVDGVVEISVSTRPDCIAKPYLECLASIRDVYQVEITIELGLQTANYRTLEKINRGHTLAEYIDAMIQIKPYSFTTCTHVILNLPNDQMCDVIETAKVISALQSTIVKVHSLYVAKGTTMCEAYAGGAFEICTVEEYLERVATFLEFIHSDMIVERLFSRVPESDSTFSNWGMSWWKLQDLLLDKLEKENRYQGKKCNYLNGAALKKLPAGAKNEEI